jgi:hypothetical protein
MTSRAEALQTEHDWRGMHPAERPRSRGSELLYTLRKIEDLEQAAFERGFMLGLAAAFTLGVIIVVFVRMFLVR